MRLIFVILFLFFTSSLFSQAESWFSGGVKTDLNDKITASAELNLRTTNLVRVEQFFPEASIKYNLSKFFKPSVDYRFVVGRDNSANYRGAHRVNVNFNFKQEIERLDFKFRLRYQSKVNSGGASEVYQPDFDNAIRLKPEIQYNIENSKLNPFIGAEWFYNPENSALGNRYRKIRFAAGITWDLPNKQELDFKYQLDYDINVPFPERIHIISISYGWEWKRDKK
ncbi:MAG: DUF2490 domain-containing protein [Lishizhenia sp.]